MDFTHYNVTIIYDILSKKFFAQYFRIRIYFYRIGGGFLFVSTVLFINVYTRFISDVFTARFYAERGIAMAGCPSVCMSVTLENNFTAY